MFAIAAKLCPPPNLSIAEVARLPARLPQSPNFGALPMNLRQAVLAASWRAEASSTPPCSVSASSRRSSVLAHSRQRSRLSALCLIVSSAARKPAMASASEPGELEVGAVPEAPARASAWRPHPCRRVARMVVDLFEQRASAEIVYFAEQAFAEQKLQHALGAPLLGVRSLALRLRYAVRAAHTQVLPHQHGDDQRRGHAGNRQAAPRRCAAAGSASTPRSTPPAGRD